MDQRFWKDFTGNFTSPAVIEALVKKFDRVLALRKPEYAETMDQFYFNMALTRDVAGYRVDAHTDPAVRALHLVASPAISTGRGSRTYRFYGSQRTDTLPRRRDG